MLTYSHEEIIDIQYRNELEEDAKFTADTYEVAEEIRTKVKQYIDKPNNVGYHLYRYDMLMQVQIEFKDRDEYPELNELYTLFRGLNSIIGDFISVALLIKLNEEESKKYFPDGKAVHPPRGRGYGYGIQFSNGSEEDAIFWANTPELSDKVLTKVRQYISKPNVGYYLSLPGMDFDYPMQVELEFKDRDEHPELNELYALFRGLNSIIGEFTWATLLIDVDEEEAKKYFPDGKGIYPPREKYNKPALAEKTNSARALFRVYIEI